MTQQLTGTNMNGSPELALSGGSITTLVWSPFGGGATRTGNTASLPGFNGERQDPLSGVTHLGNGYRAYSPALRRFTCPDSESPFGGGGINPYVYCEHDPVNNTDPSGHMPKGEIVTGEMTSRRRGAMQITPLQAGSLPVSLPEPSPGTSSAAGVTGYSSGVGERRAAPAAAVQGYTPGQRDAALRIYSTNIGAAFINTSARTENGMKLSLPELKGTLAGDVNAEYTRSHGSSEYGRLGKPEELKAAGQIIQSSPTSAVALMKEAVSKAPKMDLGEYYRGTFSTSVLDKLQKGDYVNTKFFMSVSGKKSAAETFASGRYSRDVGKGVVYSVIGAPKKLPAGEVGENEGLFNTGTVFEFLGKDNNGKYPVYSFSERTPREQEKGRKIYKIYR